MTATAPSESRPPPDDRSFFGHPKGLAFLAFTEAWERFSFFLLALQFWLVHAGLAAAAGVGFLVFKLLLRNRIAAREPAAVAP